MPKLKEFTPVLRVKDLPVALEFYRRVGFAIDFEFQGRYAGISRDGQTLHLSTVGENGQIKTQVFVTVDDIDGLYDELVKAGVDCPYAPEDMEWAQREMSIRDPDGNALRFAMPRV